MKATQLRYDGRWAVRGDGMKDGEFIHLDIQEEMQEILHTLYNTKFACGIYDATKYYGIEFFEFYFEKIDKTWAKMHYEDLFTGAFRIKKFQDKLNHQAGLR